MAQDSRTDTEERRREPGEVVDQPPESGVPALSERANERMLTEISLPSRIELGA